MFDDIYICDTFIIWRAHPISPNILFLFNYYCAKNDDKSNIITIKCAIQNNITDII